MQLPTSPKTTFPVFENVYIDHEVKPPSIKRKERPDTYVALRGRMIMWKSPTKRLDFSDTVFETPKKTKNAN